MKTVNKRQESVVESPHGGALPRSIGVMIAALGALLCWGALIGIARAFT